MAEITREGADKVLEFVSSGVANLSALTSRTRPQGKRFLKNIGLIR